MSATQVEVRPIVATDMPAVAAFLHEQLNTRVPPQAWVRAVQVPWRTQVPNFGFMLRAGGRVVGACLAFYSEREINGQRERFCNLGAWCVHPEYRFYALRPLKALLAQEGFHFTDLSPSGTVPAINSRLGFRHLDTTTALVPHLPHPSWFGRGRVSADAAVIEATLDAPTRTIYRDHADSPAARHVVLIRGDRWCYVMFRRDRRKRLPLFASVLYVSHPDVFQAMMPALARHLFVRRGIFATLAELRVAGKRPRRSVLLRTPRAKMFRSHRLDASHIDYLYSELVRVAW